VAEVLSQNEIDDLLAALSSGELDMDKMQDEDEKQAKLAITYAAKQVIANGLALLGIKAPEKM